MGDTEASLYTVPFARICSHQPWSANKVKPLPKTMHCIAGSAADKGQAHYRASRHLQACHTLHEGAANG